MSKTLTPEEVLTIIVHKALFLHRGALQNFHHMYNLYCAMYTMTTIWLDLLCPAKPTLIPMSRLGTTA